MTRMLPRLLAGFGLALAGLAGPATPATAQTDASPSPTDATAATSTATATATATGLTITARYALLGDTPDVVVLVGRYSCGPYPDGVPERGVVDLGVRQLVDGVETAAFGYLEPQACDGEPRWYAAELRGYAGSFVTGAANWSGSGYVEGPGGMQHVHVPATPIRIRPATSR
ncbi:hypothetical protein [Plantactinospora soyae]|uniref:Uncharacterized protein n=1 Tax=Plantactinospora soyae TaxID=1544732 RepID=A0A927MB89_9ACTN|nr:hypothetical protein [Plantactinospora soyae]MBE1487885.1 hypothetical protein [Plantactinospora soyae]